MNNKLFVYGAALMLFSFAGMACSRNDASASDFPGPQNDEPLVQVQAEAGDDTAQAEPSGEADITAQTADAQSADADPAAPRQVVLAGGCFWCVEAVYDQLEGVLDVESGYAGGSAETANYRAVCTGQTGHAEVVRITYDPTLITYGTLLKVFFSTAHDPTTLNRQGADVGTQYRSAIFYETEQQRQIAADYIDQLNAAEVFRHPIVTTLEPLEAYYPAEEYHQDYAERNPNEGYIRGVADPKVEHTREAHPELLRGERSEDGSQETPAEEAPAE